MPTDSKPDGAEILATLQRGEIPASLRPDVAMIWRSLSAAILVGSAVLTLLVVLALTWRFILLGVTRGDIGAWLFSVIATAVFSIPLVTIAIVHLRRRQLLFRDVTTGHVKQADGRIFWHGSEYAPHFEGQRYGSSIYHYSGIVPGPYRFYFLPNSGFVLLIEPLPGGNEAAALTQALSQALGFRMSDLGDNRQGLMSLRQRQWVWANAIGRLVLGLALLAFVVTSVVVNWPREMTNAELGLAILALAVVGVPLSFAGVYLCVGGVRLARDAANNLIEPQAGAAQLHGPVGLFGRIRLNVHGKHLTVPGRIWNALVDQREYVFYLAPISRRVLAIEPVPPPEL